VRSDDDIEVTVFEWDIHACPFCGFDLSCDVCTSPHLERQFYTGNPFLPRREGRNEDTSPPDSASAGQD
jgi:hypothetical protein